LRLIRIVHNKQNLKYRLIEIGRNFQNKGYNRNMVKTTLTKLLGQTTRKKKNEINNDEIE